MRGLIIVLEILKLIKI